MNILLKTLISSVLLFYTGFAFSQHSSIEHAHVRWKFDAVAPIRGGAVADRQNIYFGDSEGLVYCLNRLTGEENWRYKTGGAITGSPALSEGKLVVSTRSNHVYSLNSASGQVIWQFETGKSGPHTWGWDYFDATPVVYGKTVFIGSGDHHLYALDLESGKVKWQFEAGDKIRATPLIHKGLLFVPAFDGYVYVLQPDTGNSVARYATKGVEYYGKIYGWDRSSITTRPACQDSLLVFGSRDGGLYCINSENLHTKWRFTYGPSWVGSSPVISNSTVYVGWSDQLYFSAVDLLTGKELWSYNCRSYVYSTPVFDSSNVYVGAFDGNFYAFDKSNGSVKWKYQTGGSVLSSPLLMDATLYVGNDNGEMYAFINGEAVHKAMYLPENCKKNELLSSEKIAPYLQKYGYQQLDTTTLVRFMRDRVKDRKPSVIVFAYQYLPREVAGTDPGTSLLKSYMDAGGRVVWPGYFPEYWTTDGDRNITGLNPNYAASLLEVNFDVNMDLGTYYAKATAEGLRWGLPDTFNALGSSISDRSNVVPLAYNELGRIVSFLKPFGEHGGGFVLYRSWSYMPIREADLQTLRAIAEHDL